MSRSIWSSSVTSSDDYTTTGGDGHPHHNHLPMTSPSASSSHHHQSSSFPLTPLASVTLPSSYHHSPADLLVHEQHSNANSDYVQNLQNMGYSSATSTVCSFTGSNRTLSALTCGDNQGQPPLPLEESATSNFFRNPFPSAMAYTPDSPWLYPGFTQEIFESFHNLADPSLLDGFPHSMPHQHPYTGQGILNSAATFVNYLSNGAVATMGPPARPRKPGGRRPKEEECKLPPEEEEKRRLRRIRNKEAAARCRKRRLDQMTTLEIKVNELQTHQSRLESDLDRLEQEKHELEFMLKSHEGICQCRDIKSFAASIAAHPPTSLKLQQHHQHQPKSDPEDALMDDDDDSRGKSQDPTLSSVVVLTTNTTAKGVAKTSSSLSTDSELLARPSTLPLQLKVVSLNTPGLDETPSREYFNLLNQPTGLTPITSGGGLTPLLFTSTSACVPSLETPSVAESKIGANLTKL